MELENKVKLHNNIDTYECDAKDLELTSEGYLIVDALATRTGVFKYQQRNGTVVRQYRPKEEVLNKDSYQTLSNKPVTNEHPVEFVNSKNVKDYQVGFVRDSVSVVDDKFLKVQLMIQDHDTIQEIQKKNKFEVSCGYTCTHDLTDGEHNNEKYDVIQRNINYNHLSIVYKGRAGDQVRLITDSEDNSVFYMCDDSIDNDKENQDCIKLRSKMEKITIDGVSQEVSQEFKAAYEKNAESKKMADAQAEVGRINDELSEVTAERDSLKEKVSGLEKEVSKYDSLISEREKIDLLAEAISKQLITNEDSFEDKTLIEIKKEILTKNEAYMSMDSDVYIEGRYADFLHATGEKLQKQDHIKFDSEKIVKQEDKKEASIYNQSPEDYKLRLRERRMKKKGVK